MTEPEPSPGPVEPSAARPEDEARHEPGEGLWWSESTYLDLVDPASGVAAYLRLGILPNQRRCWYWACLVGPDRPLVTVIDHDIALPRPDRHEIRGEGIWADMTVETPLEHVSASLEAFAVALDDPTDAYGDLRGERTAFGFDLEWETDGSTYAYPGVDRYEVPSKVHGEILVGQEVIKIDGWGQRDHSWGERDWWALGWSWSAARLDDGTRLHGVHVDLEGASLYETGYVQGPDGPMVGLESTGHQEDLGPEGLPTRGTWSFGTESFDVTPVAFAPVLLEDGTGRTSRFPRAWSRFESADGRVGDGWIEWNQPQP